MEEKKSTYKGYSQAQNRATQKYKQANYENIVISVKKGTRDKYKNAAAKTGLSFAQFALEAMDEKIERDLLD